MHILNMKKKQVTMTQPMCHNAPICATHLHQKGGCMSPHKCAPKWHLFFGSSLLHVTKS